MSDADQHPGAIEQPGAVQAMFGRIAGRYDLMNRLMTGGQDARWREKAVRAVLAGDAGSVLDIATGTGDLAFALAQAGIADVVGLDFALPMLERAAAKQAGQPTVRFVAADAMRMPFRDRTFAACTIAFGLRNLPDYAGALAEIRRLLEPGGRLVCLELTPLRPSRFGRLFAIYFLHVVPRIGGWVSGERDAYRYLPSSVAAFPAAETLAAMMRAAGFEQVTFERLGLGTVALHVAIVPGQSPLPDTRA